MPRRNPKRALGGFSSGKNECAAFPAKSPRAFSPTKSLSARPRAASSERSPAVARAIGCRGARSEPVSVSSILLASSTRGSINLRYASASGPRVAPVSSVERSSIAAAP